MVNYKHIADEMQSLPANRRQRKSRYEGICFFLNPFSKNRNGERHLNRSPSIGIWQAWRSPASLRARPLSLPAACGCHEIDHLKYLSYPMYKIPHLLFFVKDISLSQQSTEAFSTDLPHCNDGIFILCRIIGNFQSQNNLSRKFCCYDLFQYQCRMRTISSQDIIRIL